MTPVAFREIRPPLIHAARTSPRFGPARPKNMTTSQATGIRFEKKVHRALISLTNSLIKQGLPAKLEYQPWFEFQDSVGYGCCAPDFLLSFGLALTLIIDAKLTWVPTAEAKMAKLYTPVVNKTLTPRVLRSLVICNNLTPESPRPISNIGSGTSFSVNSTPIYHWLGQGKLVW